MLREMPSLHNTLLTNQHITMRMLISACLRNPNPAVAQLLHSVKPTIDDNVFDAMFLADVCKRAKQFEVLKWLYSINPRFVTEKAFIASIESRDLNVVQWVYDKVPQIDLSGPDGIVAFEIAFAQPNLNVFRWLMDIGKGKVVIRATDEMQYSFACVCGKGNLELAREMLDLDIGVDITANNNNAFRQACANDQMEVAKWLTKSGRIIGHVDCDYLFREACMHGHLTIATWLYNTVYVAQPINIHSFNEFAFRYACQNGHLHVVKWLRKTAAKHLKSIDVAANNHEAFKWAWKDGHTDVVQWLAEQYPEHKYKYKLKGSTAWIDDVAVYR